jgi:hypothetical protein
MNFVQVAADRGIDLDKAILSQRRARSRAQHKDREKTFPKPGCEHIYGRRNYGRPFTRWAGENRETKLLRICQKAALRGKTGVYQHCWLALNHLKTA